ncbi:MAG: GGDEF domain-containing protein [Motiliproteus sp.]
MLVAVTHIMAVVLVAELMAKMLLAQLNFTVEQILWLDPLLNAAAITVVVVVAVPVAQARAGLSIASSREWVQLKSALIVFGFQALLALSKPLLFGSLTLIEEMLLEAGLFSALATLGIYLWVLLPEQALVDQDRQGHVRVPYISPWLTGIAGYLFVMLLIGLVLITLSKDQQQQRYRQIAERQSSGLSLVHSVLVHEFYNSLQDVLVMSRKADLIGYIEGDDQHAKHVVEQDFQSLVSTRKAYRSIRYFDDIGARISVTSNATLQRTGLFYGRLSSDQQLLHDSLSLGAGEASVAPVFKGRTLVPIRMVVPVFDRIGLHQGVLVVELNSDYLISLLSESFGREHGDLMLLHDGAPSWLTFSDRAGATLAQLDAAVDWARQDDGLKGADKLDGLTASYQRLLQVPEQVTGINRFFPHGGWPEWTLLAVLPDSRLRSDNYQMTQLYLLVFGLVALALGLLMLVYTRIYMRQLLVEQRIYNMAHHDSLTGLDNRQLFHEKLELELAHALRDHSLLGLMYMDLDRFKPINDHYGHEVGDRALCEVARRLRPALRSSDSLARIGGDEFAVILPNISDEHELEHIASRLVATLDTQLDLQGNRCQLGISIGICQCRGELSTEEFIRRADKAMYAAKQESGTGFRLARSDFDSDSAEIQEVVTGD